MDGRLKTLGLRVNMTQSEALNVQQMANETVERRRRALKPHLRKIGGLWWCHHRWCFIVKRLEYEGITLSAAYCNWWQHK